MASYQTRNVPSARAGDGSFLDLEWLEPDRNVSSGEFGKILGSTDPLWANSSSAFNGGVSKLEALASDWGIG